MPDLLEYVRDAIIDPIGALDGMLDIICELLSTGGFPWL